MTGSRPLIKDRRTALWLGVGLSLAGSILLWDAFENRGKGRPFATRFLPGV